MAITPLPSAPQRGTDAPAAYVAKADAMMAALPAFVTEANATASSMSSSASTATAAAASATAAAATAIGSGGTLFATSTTSQSVTVASKPMTFVESGKTFSIGQYVNVARTSAAGTTRMLGTITAVDNTAKTMTVNVESVVGSGGPFTDWTISIAASNNLPAATVAQVIAGTSLATSIPPGALAAAGAFVALTDAATIAWDASLAIKAKVTLGGSRTFGAPTNMQDGQDYALKITQDATGSRTIIWNAFFDWGSQGTPTLSTGAGKVDFVFGIYASDTGKLHAQFRKAA